MNVNPIGMIQQMPEPALAGLAGAAMASIVGRIPGLAVLRESNPALYGALLAAGAAAAVELLTSPRAGATEEPVHPALRPPGWLV